MNKIVIAAVSAVVLSVATLAHAGDGCCPSKAAGKDKAADCGSFLSKLNLTDAQKAKVDALKKVCHEGDRAEAGQTKFMTGLKEVLTEEQWTQFTAECQKNKASCPVGKANAEPAARK